ncbi:HTH-type transcriptional repressor NicR [Clavibacter michiganensis]|uniref:HTH-type transcriptional repressor NicR n=1 Tax=Clavibacter michiganensis TaxID=28447 RepID=A0A251XWQ1_9MICO|nr:HTH-type transcriptional repressor NicR [Clavibacter michiganensis]
MSELPGKGVEEAPDDAARTGAALERAVLAITRWASRPDVRRRMLADEGGAFSATDTWLLGHLMECGATRMRVLADWQGVDKSTMTAHVQRLEARGLVVREADPGDRRAVLVRATPDARRALDRNSATARALLGELVGKWSARERTELTRLLGRLVAEIEAEGGGRAGDAPDCAAR